MGQNVQTYTFAVNTDAGETGLSDKRSIDGIIDAIRLDYDASADAGTNVTVRGNESGSIFTIHSEAANATDKVTVPSEKSPRLVNCVVEVAVDSAGGALTPAVTVVLEVLVG